MAYARDFKGIWIPKEIYLAQDLNWTEKILLVEIDSLDNEEGCFASNDHFAGFLGISKGRVSKNISALIKKGYVTSHITYKPNSKEVDRRTLHTTIEYRRPRSERIVADDQTPVAADGQESYTVFNNTKSNIKQQKEKGGINALIAAYTTNQELISSIRGFIQMRAAIKRPVTDRALMMLLERLDKLENTDERKMQVLDQSTLRCWQDIFPLKEENEMGKDCRKEDEDSNNPFDL